jgi:hypothetical protein
MKPFTPAPIEAAASLIAEYCRVICRLVAATKLADRRSIARLLTRKLAEKTGEDSLHRHFIASLSRRIS